MIRFLALALSASLVVIPATQQAQPASPTAEALLAPAFARAASENKTVLIDFSAKTWCVPCFKLRAFLTAPEIAPIVDAHFVVVELTVWENRGNLHLNNAGAEAQMARWDFSGGIPFVVFADAKRRVLATSVSTGFGGFPGSQPEIEAFVGLFVSASPRITAAERTVLTNWLSTRADKFGSIAGRVLGTDGEPVPKAVVSVLERTYADGRWRPVQRHTVTTDAAGRYAIERIAPGSYRVMVDAGPAVAPAPAAPPRTAAVTFYPSTTRYADAAVVVVAPNQDLQDMDVSLTLASPRRVNGRAVGPDGRALVGASISLTNVDWPAANYSATTRADGAFAVEGVRPGRYQAWVQSVAVGTQPRDLGSASLDLHRADALDLRLVTSVSATLSGTLTIEGGTLAPADRAAIRVAAMAVEPAAGAPGILRQASVDGAGRFDVRGLFGKRVIRVTDLPAGWVLSAVRRDGIDITDRAIDIGSDVRSLEIVLRRGAQISGTVADAAAQPAKGGAVIVFAADASRWTYPSRFLKSAPVQDNGTFAVRGLPPGRYLVLSVESLSSGWDAPDALESLRPRATAVELGDGDARQVTVIAKGGQR